MHKNKKLLFIIHENKKGIKKIGDDIKSDNTRYDIKKIKNIIKKYYTTRK